MTDPRSRYVWDDRLGRYRDRATGRLVGRAEIRRDVDATLAKAEGRIEGLAARMRAGEISLDEFAVAMRREIKTVHLWNAAAARGGWGQMTPADFGRVGAIVRRQYGYFERFLRDVERGLPLDGRFAVRSRMYGESGTATFEHFHTLEAREHGAGEERNVLGAAEHCVGCLAQSARGWVPIGDLVPVGQRDCRSRCKCRKEFR